MEKHPQDSVHMEESDAAAALTRTQLVSDNIIATATGRAAC